MTLVKLVYEGPPQQSNAAVGRATGDSRLTPGREIEVSEELATKLQRSTPYWVSEALDATEGAKELAGQQSVNLSQVEGTGSSGRISKADVERHLAEHKDDGAEDEPGESEAEQEKEG